MKHNYFYILVISIVQVLSASQVKAEICGTKDYDIQSNEIHFQREDSDSVSPFIIVGLDGEGFYRVWDEDQQHELSYCISNNFKSHKALIVDAVAEAASEWMRYANVTFIYKPEEDSNCNANNSNILFRIDIKNSRRTRYRAKAFFPGDELEKRRVLFKKKHITDSPQDLVRLSLHELGHVLGFRHEHIHPKAVKDCRERSPYRPITDYDITSIMHYPMCGGRNSGGLSDLDKQGASALYPF